MRSSRCNILHIIGMGTGGRSTYFAHTAGIISLAARIMRINHRWFGRCFVGIFSIVILFGRIGYGCWCPHIRIIHLWRVIHWILIARIFAQVARFRLISFAFCIILRRFPVKLWKVIVVSDFAFSGWNHWLSVRILLSKKKMCASLTCCVCFDL